MTLALLKGEEVLSGELFRSTSAFSLERGGVLYEPTFPLTRPLTQVKQVFNCTVQTRENISIEIYWVTSLKNPYKGKNESPNTMYSVIA